MHNNKLEINNKPGNFKKVGLSLLQNLSVPITDIALRLQLLNPEWGVMIGMGAGLLSMYRELAEDRGVELLDFIEKHKNEFSEAVVRSSEFKATFINIWEMHIRENSEMKRKRLRKFLLNLGKGVAIESDFHTKMFSIIDQMTEMEAKCFDLLISISNREQFRNMHLNILNDNQATNPFLEYTEETLQDVFHSLDSYRLVNIVNAQIGKGMVVTQITKFGEMFYDFVFKE